MLKLESRSNRQQISIVLSKKKRLLSSHFFLALLLALFVHLLGVIFFSVKPLIVTERTSILPKVAVSIEKTEEKSESVRAFAEKEKRKKNTQLFLPPLTPPDFDPLPEMLSAASIAYPDLSKSYQFMPFEHTVLFLEGILPFYEKKTKQPPLIVRLSGNLWQKEILNPECVQRIAEKILEKESIQPDIMRYEVKVAGQSGKIFWKREIEKGKNKRCRRAAEKVLRSLKLQAEEKKFAEEGVIEVIFFQTEKK